MGGGGESLNQAVTISTPFPPTHMEKSFPTQLACRDVKQNLIFHGAQSIKHVQIPYKDMLYLILYRLII